MSDITEKFDAVRELLSLLTDELDRVNGQLSTSFILYKRNSQKHIPVGDIDTWNATCKFDDALSESVGIAADATSALQRGLSIIEKAVNSMTASRDAHKLTDPEVRKQVFDLTDGHCAYCGTELVVSGGEQEQFCIEHVVPVSMGGPNHLVNYVPSCRACNNSKGDRHVLYFIQNSFVLRSRAPIPVSPILEAAE